MSSSDEVHLEVATWLGAMLEADPGLRVTAITSSYRDVRALYVPLLARIPRELILDGIRSRFRILNVQSQSLNGLAFGIAWVTCPVEADALQGVVRGLRMGMRHGPGFLLATDHRTGDMELSRRAVVEGTFPETTLDQLVVDLIRAEEVQSVMAS